MEFRDLKKQYKNLKPKIDEAVIRVMNSADFIAGAEVSKLEKRLAAYVGAAHCITCANGTDALTLALMVWNIKKGDAVFVPDFTFFSTGETVSYQGATPIFVDVEENTFNISPDSLEKAIREVEKRGELKARAIIAVDLFGQPADYVEIRKIADKYHLYILEDAAQGFGGKIGDKHACNFGDISTTSFFPAKPLGSYGDGGAVFTNNDKWAEIIRSLCVHGKGQDKYDNVRIGLNSRLDTIQAAILQVKMDAFEFHELDAVNKIAKKYTNCLKNIVNVPTVLESYYSSWAQYVILMRNNKERDLLQTYLKEKKIPSMIYYRKPMHRQKAFCPKESIFVDLSISESICDRVLALPMHPYLEDAEIQQVTDEICKFVSL